MNESLQNSIGMVDAIVQGGVFHTVEAEMKKFRDSTIYRDVVYLEPPFTEFNILQPYSKDASKLRLAVIKEEIEELDVFEIVCPLLDKPHLLCEEVSNLHSIIPSQMSFEVIGNSQKIQMFATADKRFSLGFTESWRVIPALEIRHCADPLAFLEDSGNFYFVEIFPAAAYYRRMSDSSSQLITNPMVNLMSLLSKLDENEMGFLQVIYQPVKHDWASNIEKILQLDPKICQGIIAPKNMSIRQLKTYGEKKLFSAKIRIGCATANDRLSLLNSYFGQFHYGGRPFKFLESKEFFEKIGLEKTKQMIVKRQSHATGMLLCGDELTCFICLPDESIRNYGSIKVRIIDNTRVQFKVPEELTTAGRPLGVNEYGGVKQIVVLPNSQKNKSIYMIGSTTYGKTWSIICQILHLKGRFAVIFIEPHDAADELMGHLTEEDIERTVYFNPALEGFVPDYSAFVTTNDEAAIGRLVVDFASAFESIFEGHTGYRMMHILTKLLYAARVLGLNLGIIPTLLSRNATAKALIGEVMRKTRNVEVKRFFEHEIWTYPDDAFLPIINKISNMFLDEKLALLFSRTKNRMDIPRMIREKKLFIASLPVGILGGSNVGIIGSFLISQVQQAAFAQVSLPPEKRSQVFIFVDEFHRFPAYKIIASIINECRKYGLHICLAHQETGQIPDSILKSLFSIPNAMCFNVNIDDSKKIASAFGGAITPADITKLGIGEVYAKISNKITSFKTFPPRNDYNEEIKQRIIEHSIKNYYTPVSELQEESARKQREYDLF